MLRVEERKDSLLTHELVAAGPIPTAYDPEGVYPYESYCETGRRPVIRKYRRVVLENDRLRATICPDLGGRVDSLFLKRPGVETLCVTHVVRPVRILPRHFFIGGGIEVSFPISHTPSQIVPVRFDMARDGGRIYVSCGEREQRFGMQWTVEYSLGEEDAFLTQRTVFFNPGATPHPWMSWSNAGVPARPDTEFHFPGGPVLSHGGEMRTIDWKTEGPRRQSDIARMTGFFWRDPDCCAFGAFTPSLGAGLYHVADPALTPGIKLWSDGVGRDERWVSQYTLAGEQAPRRILDSLGGAATDSGDCAAWTGTAGTAGGAAVRLGAVGERVLLARGGCGAPFGRSRRTARGARPGKQRLGSERNGGTGPGARMGRGADRRSGTGQPAVSTRSVAGRARRAGRGPRGSRRVAGRSSPGAGRPSRDAASARLEGSRGVLPCHRVRGGGPASPSGDRNGPGPGRARARDPGGTRSPALEDEWLAERRAAVLLAGGDAQGAREILENTRFQLVHQRYRRTRLWREVESKLGLEPVEYPAWLGEDDLAEFGAYREYAED